MLGLLLATLARQEASRAGIDLSLPALLGEPSKINEVAVIYPAGTLARRKDHIAITRIRLYFVCSPKIARRVLGDTPKLSAIMPCSWSVYELADGSVWLAHMNIAMMSRMMGGVVGAAMSSVAAADERFMARILR